MAYRATKFYSNDAGIVRLHFHCGCAKLSYRDEHRPTALLLHKQTLPQLTLFRSGPSFPIKSVYLLQSELCVFVCVFDSVSGTVYVFTTRESPFDVIAQITLLLVTGYSKIYVNTYTLSPNSDSYLTCTHFQNSKQKQHSLQWEEWPWHVGLLRVMHFSGSNTV